MDWVNELAPHWHWLAIGLILAAAEMAIPGIFLIWMAGAAIVTGLVVWAVPIGLPVQVVLFAVLAMASVLTGRRYLRSHPIEGVDPLMNDRGGQAGGGGVGVTHAIDGRGGRGRVGGSERDARGPPPALHDGTLLVVEHLH